MPLDSTTWNIATTTPPFTIEALLQLKRVLQEVEENPHKKLDMWNFGTQAPCGTAVCALGWAARDLWFISQGLRLELFHNFDVAKNFFRITEKQATKLFAPAFRWSSVPNAIQRIDKLLAELGHVSA